MKQGDIYLVDLDPVVGLELGGEQWVVVVSTDLINASLFPAVVVPAVDARRSTFYQRLGVLIPAADSGLPVDVVASCLHVRALDRSRFTAPPIGAVPANLVRDIETALHVVFRV